MGLLNDCELLFGTRNLYQLLQIKDNAAESDIKKAYRKLSLRVHPDRAAVDEKEHATTKFQVLSKVSKVLLDKDLRSVYDAEGEVDDECNLNDKNIKDWSQYWKTMFNLSVEDLKKFEEEYRFSDMESDDLKSIYLECKGDMDMIFEKQLCAYIEDESRFRKVLQDAIDNGEIPSFDAFANESKSKQKKRKQFYEKEKKEAEKERKKHNLGKSESDLEKLIMSRQETRRKQMDSFLNDLEAKYAKPTKTKAKSSKRKKV